MLVHKSDQCHFLLNGLQWLLTAFKTKPRLLLYVVLSYPSNVAHITLFPFYTGLFLLKSYQALSHLWTCTLLSFSKEKFTPSCPLSHSLRQPSFSTFISQIKFVYKMSLSTSSCSSLRRTNHSVMISYRTYHSL